MGHDETTPSTQATQRLWTPWRMNYVGGGTKEEGCIFCNRLERSDDIESLILYRADHSFVIMNLFPYNTGHVMLVPNQHASDPIELEPETLAELGTLLPTLTQALRRAFACHGFNVGLNIGAIAGAGVEAHLHEHIVPRWQGDANFMPIIASTMTIPELIPVTYAKIRAELTREVTSASTATIVLLDQDGERVLLHHGRLPEVHLESDWPITDAVRAALPQDLEHLQLAGWAGPKSASNPGAGDIALTFIGAPLSGMDEGWTTLHVDELGEEIDREIVLRAKAQLAPRC